jgi:hypothetical protein
MRHLIVATTMIMVALVITFGTASVLQGVATAHVAQPEPFVVEAARPAVRPAAIKERMTTQIHERTRPEVHAGL